MVSLLLALISDLAPSTLQRRHNNIGYDDMRQISAGRTRARRLDADADPLTGRSRERCSTTVPDGPALSSVLGMTALRQWTAQQWLCEQILGSEPAAEQEKPKPRCSQAGNWAIDFTATTPYHQCEGHLRVLGDHTERTIAGGGDDRRDGESGGRQEKREIGLGARAVNQRSRAVTLSLECADQLSAVGMRWT
ncbi:hypothetical protein [Streptomyces chilikensis]|uniref:hypothetical protein n=1 Tax=Streptomyces chilikensis TaxID=1194079 RepID=UPI000B287B5B|nr:hypothetical protein [Streptomyces chilikensis]